MNYRYSPPSRFIDAQQIASIASGGAYAYRKLLGQHKRAAYCLYQMIEIKYITWSFNLLSNK
ncbi:hypothetical protein [Stenotrophomonas phage RAS14]